MAKKLFKQFMVLGLSGMVIGTSMIIPIQPASAEKNKPTAIAVQVNGEDPGYIEGREKRRGLKRFFSFLFFKKEKPHRIAEKAESLGPIAYSADLVPAPFESLTKPAAPQALFSQRAEEPRHSAAVEDFLRYLEAQEAAERESEPEVKAEAKAGGGEALTAKLAQARPDRRPQPQAGSEGNIYNMLTAAGLPELDNDQPMVHGNGSAGIQVLKSGISKQANEVGVTVGKAVVVNLSRPAERVSISNPDIASAVVISPTQIQLVGNMVGVANLLVWADAGSPEHSAIDISVHRDVGSLKRQLHFVDPNIQIVPMAADDTVILTGEAASREAAQLAVALAKAYFKPEGGGAATAGGGSVAPHSASPGSATALTPSPNIINLIKVKGEPSTKLESARQKLHMIDPNIQLDIVPGPDGIEKAILRGKVHHASAVSEAINLAAVFYGKPGVRVVTGPGGNLVREEAGNSNFQDDTAFNTNMNVNVLQGSVMTDASGNVVSLLEVAHRPQIRAQVQFLEINRSDLDALGMNAYGVGKTIGLAHRSGLKNGPPGTLSVFPTTEESGAAISALTNPETFGNTRNTRSFGASFTETFADGLTQVLNINDQTTLAINALQNNRKARSLAEPTLTMLSGEKASFLAGGEIPFAFTGGNGQVVIEYKEFGIRLNLVSTVTEDGKIHMIVAPEVSSLDVANGADTGSGVVPALRSRRMQTTLEVENGQSFIIAGLYSQDEVDSISGTPWISRVPIIGSFFRNKWKNKNNTELVVIIKPEIMMTAGGPGLASARAEK